MVKANNLQRRLPLPEESGDRRLLTPGWGGDLSAEELTFIQQRLLMNPGLFRRWGFRSSSKRRSEAAIRERAMQG